MWRFAYSRLLVLVCLDGEQKGLEGQIVKPLRKPRYGAEQLSTSACMYMYNAVTIKDLLGRQSTSNQGTSMPRFWKSNPRRSRTAGKVFLW
jgi:hypothetical protein